MSKISPEPIFVLGGPRSGTTMLRLMISSHKDICIPPECGFALWLYDKYKDWGKEQGYDRYLTDLVNTKKFETWGLNSDEILKVIENEDPRNYAHLAKCVYKAYAVKMGYETVRIGDKNNFYIDYLDSLKALYPSACVIWIVRDPRDVFCSYREVMSKNTNSSYAPNLPTDVETFCEQWEKVIASFEKAKSLFCENIHITKYESIVSQPEKAAMQLCKHMQMPYDENMLRFYEMNDEPMDFTPWKGNTFKPVGDSSLGRYKLELQSNQIEIIERRLLVFLKDHGYLDR